MYRFVFLIGLLFFLAGDVEMVMGFITHDLHYYGLSALLIVVGLLFLALAARQKDRIRP